MEGVVGGLKAPSTFGFRIFALETVALASCDFLSLQMAGPCGVPKVTLCARAAKSYRPYDVQRSTFTFFSSFFIAWCRLKLPPCTCFVLTVTDQCFLLFFQPNASYLIKKERLRCCQFTLCAPRQHQEHQPSHRTFLINRRLIRIKMLRVIPKVLM